MCEIEFGNGSCAAGLLSISLDEVGYNEAAAGELARAARGFACETWPERQLAVLLLENQFLRLEPERRGEFAPILRELGLDSSLSDSLLAELAHRLRRLGRVHAAIRSDADSIAWRYVFRVARDISKLTFARYAFRADEVVEEILRTVTVSRGVSSGAPAPTLMAPPPELPEYEREILSRLCTDRRIYWVSERCGSELNALVEYPLTSAVLVIKPPGSDVEFEIKRAGTRGPRLLNVIGRRNGKEAPVSHRMFGGSLGWLGSREASAADLFSRMYRLVHSKDAGCSRTVAISSVVTVPSAAGEVHMLDYLTQPEIFGEGYEEMRDAMRLCVATFPSDTGVARASYEGEAGQTLRFIGQALPQQAIISGSSSFRLDRIQLYLSEEGPEHYFGSRGHTRSDLRWLADSVLEEILGEITAPPEGFQSYSQYVSDAFRVPENRCRADAGYLSAMRQTGECWGTLLALRGFSDGESFVQRNVGLKSCREGGEWQVRVIFMDHDDLTMAGSRYRYLWPSREVPGMMRDQVHVLGGRFSDDFIPGSAGALRNIFRADGELAERGTGMLQESLRNAYFKTSDRIDNDAELQSLLYPEFVARHRDYDRLAACWLDSGAADPDGWEAQAVVWLRSRDFGEELATESARAVVQFGGFFERMRFLFAKEYSLDNGA